MLKTDVAELLRKNYGKKNPPVLCAGETVRVHQKIREGEKERIQIFEGLVIAIKHGDGLDGSFTVRKIAAGGIGVERTYPLHSPNIVKVERTRKAEVSRAKLYYMRDRMGKNARFKHEGPNKASWSEDDVVAGATPVVEETIEETVVEPVSEAVEVEEVLVEAATEQEEEIKAEEKDEASA